MNHLFLAQFSLTDELDNIGSDDSLSSQDLLALGTGQDSEGLALTTTVLEGFLQGEDVKSWLEGALTALLPEVVVSPNGSNEGQALSIASFQIAPVASTGVIDELVDDEVAYRIPLESFLATASTPAAQPSFEIRAFFAPTGDTFFDDIYAEGYAFDLRLSLNLDLAEIYSLYNLPPDPADVEKVADGTLFPTTKAASDFLTAYNQALDPSVAERVSGNLRQDNNSPSGTLSISGTATQGQTLTANTSGIADADGLGTFSYQWFAGTSPVSGATSSSYTLRSSDVGSRISVEVRYVDQEGTSEVVVSRSTGLVQAQPVVTTTSTELRVSTPDLHPSSDLGVSNSDNITSDNTPLITGTATPGVTVDLFDAEDNSLLGSTVARSDGSWQMVAAALALGSHSLVAKATDSNGLLEVSAPLGVVITPSTVDYPVTFVSGDESGTTSITIQSVQQITSKAALDVLQQQGVQINANAVAFKLNVRSGLAQANANLQLFVVADDLNLLANDGSRDVSQRLVYYAIDALGVVSALSFDPRRNAGARFYDTDGDGIADLLSLKLEDGGFGDKDGIRNGEIVDPSAAGVATLNPILQAASQGFLTVSDPESSDVPAALALKASLKSRSSVSTEIGYVVLNADELSNPDAVLGNLSALRERSQNLFTTLESSDVVLPTGLRFDSEFLLRNNQSIRFFSIADATLSDLADLSDPRLSFLDLDGIDSSGNASFSAANGVSLQLALLEGDQGLDALIAQEQQQSPVLDFSAFADGQELTATLALGREADRIPLTGFYRTVSADGSVVESDGSLLRPDESGYAAAALAEGNRVSVLDQLSVGDGQTVSRDVVLQESAYLAPYARVQGQTFFAFAAANSDGYAHFRTIGINAFGLEDRLGGGDRDHDDHVLALSFTRKTTA